MILPVSYCHVAAIFVGNLCGVHFVTRVAVSSPALRIDSSNTSATFNSQVNMVQICHFHADSNQVLSDGTVVQTACIHVSLFIRVNYTAAELPLASF